MGGWFPEGQRPAWAAKGKFAADFWAPEMVEVDDEYWVVFTARQVNNALAIGLARSTSPLGPFVDNGQPVLVGKTISAPGLPQGVPSGVIDSHIFTDADGTRYLLWKDDRNGIWPRPLAMLLRERPDVIDRLFEREQDRKSAAFAAAIVPFANTRRPMEQFS